MNPAVKARERVAVEKLRGHAFSMLEAGRLREAFATYEQILAVAPRDAFSLHNTGMILVQQGELSRAIERLTQAVQADPTMLVAFLNLGKMKVQQKDWSGALKSFERAAALDPNSSEAQYWLGHSLYVLLRYPEALRALNTSVALRPDPEAMRVRCACLADNGRPLEALAAYEELTSRFPDFARALHGKGTCLLQLGKLQDGWPLTDGWRRQFPPLSERQFPAPLWTGDEDLSGKTICIHWEQGLGDTLQFCRYAGPLLERGARVWLMVQPALRAIVSDSWPDARVITDVNEAIGADFHCPLMSLPGAFRTSLETVPRHVPYLRADPRRVDHWRGRLDASTFNVGICWHGHLGQLDIGRSFPVTAATDALARIPNVRLISLQRDAKTGDCPAVHILSDELDRGADAFLDTAAIIQNLDLVISADTSVAHLAGALAKPCWVALKVAPEWRWLLDRSDSPWYPTMRLFRQRSPGDWRSVFDQMAAAITPLCSGR